MRTGRDGLWWPANTVEESGPEVADTALGCGDFDRAAVNARLAELNIIVREVVEAREPLYDSYADCIVRRERDPGIGPLAGFREADGKPIGSGPPNPHQLRYIANGSFWRHHLTAGQLYYKYSNRRYLEDAKAMGMTGDDSKTMLEIYSEALQKLCLAAESNGPIVPPERVARFTPLAKARDNRDYSAQRPRTKLQWEDSTSLQYVRGPVDAF